MSLAIQMIQADLIYLSASIKPDCEKQFVKLRAKYPEIKRVHGAFDFARALSICAQISDTDRFVIVTPDDHDLIAHGATSEASLSSDLPSDSFGVFNRSQITIAGSVPAQRADSLDVVYLTYEEEIADANFAALKERYPHIMRLHRVRGLTRAFRMSAELVTTPWYILIDGDNEILPEFDLTQATPPAEESQVKIFFTRNPVNGLEYGYGGVKVCPTDRFRRISNDAIDPIASGDLKPVFDQQRRVASVTRFNTSAFNAWKAGFRESTMLAAQADEALGTSPEWAREKLQVWQAIGAEQPFGTWAIAGARDGEAFVKSILSALPANSAKRTAVKEHIEVINDPHWLKARFSQQHPDPKPTVELDPR